MFRWHKFEQALGVGDGRNATVHGVAKIWTWLIELNRAYHAKCQAIWVTSWNQDCWEKYQELEIHRCEMKLSPAILINKKCHSHHWFLISKYEWGLPKLWSRGCCYPHSDCWGAGGIQKARWARKQDWPKIAEVHMKGMSSVSPEAFIFPDIEGWIP